MFRSTDHPLKTDVRVHNIDFLSWVPKFFVQTLTLYPDLSFHLERPFNLCVATPYCLFFFLTTIYQTPTMSHASCKRPIQILSSVFKTILASRHYFADGENKERLRDQHLIRLGFETGLSLAWIQAPCKPQHLTGSPALISNWRETTSVVQDLGATDHFTQASKTVEMHLPQKLLDIGLSPESM